MTKKHVTGSWSAQKRCYIKVICLSNYFVSLNFRPKQIHLTLFGFEFTFIKLQNQVFETVKIRKSKIYMYIRLFKRAIYNNSAILFKYFNNEKKSSQNCLLGHVITICILFSYERFSKINFRQFP